MERREVLRRTLASGFTLIVSQLVSDGEVLAAPKVKVEFQEGTLTGGDFDGWSAQLAVTGNSIRGTCWDPKSESGKTFTGWRVRGRKRGSALNIGLYDAKTPGFDVAVGTGKGKHKGKRLTARLVLPSSTLQGATQTASMATQAVKTSPAKQRQFSGKYLGIVTDNSAGLAGGEPAGSFSLVVDANGKFRLDDIVATAPGVEGSLPTKTSGRWGMTADERIYTSTLADNLVTADGPVTYSEVNVGRIVKGSGAIVVAAEGGCNLCDVLSCHVSPPPTAPGDFVATALAGLRIRLAWTDRSNNEDEFRIERKVGDDEFATLVRLPADTRLYLDEGLTAGKTYTYRVFAHSLVGDSDPIPPRSATARA